MNGRPITVAELITFLQTCPPDAKIRVMEEVNIGWDTATRFVEVTQFCEVFNDNVFDTIDGIDYSVKNKTVDFGM